MLQDPLTLARDSHRKLGRRAFSILALWAMAISFLLALLWFPNIWMMRLIFALIPALTVDNAQVPVVVIPLAALVFSVVTLFAAAGARQVPGILMAVAAILFSTLALLFAIFGWIPIFRA